MTDQPESKVVEAVGIAISHADRTPLAERIAEAMRQAVIKAQADGVTDPDKIRAAMMAARDAVMTGETSN
jgi:hypothetical protein